MRIKVTKAMEKAGDEICNHLMTMSMKGMEGIGGYVPKPIPPKYMSICVAHELHQITSGGAIYAAMEAERRRNL